MTARICPNGHAVDASWETCPFCPAGARRPVPPTRVPGSLPAGAPPPPFAPPFAPPLTFAPPASLMAPQPSTPRPLAPPPPAPQPPVPPPAAYGLPPRPPRPKTEIRGVALAQEKALPVVGWLVVLSGAHRGEDFRLRDGKNTIGSEPGCEIVISDGHISARHARINTVVKEGERIYVLHDLDSRNGTFLNEREEPVYHEELVDNDTVTFGTIRCKFKCI